MSDLLSFSRYQRVCVFKFLFDELTTPQTSRFSLILEQWWRGNGNTKTWIFWEQKKIFRWNKKQFSWFCKHYLLKKKRKMVNISFKHFLNNAPSYMFDRVNKYIIHFCIHFYIHFWTFCLKKFWKWTDVRWDEETWYPLIRATYGC